MATTEIAQKNTTTNPYEQGSSGDAPVCPGLEKWLIVKGKENITRDGNTYWWCPHHKRDNLYDDMYTEHDPGESNKSWKANIDEKKSRRKKETSTTSSISTASPEDIFYRHQLKLSGKLQALMMTDLKLSKDELDCSMNT